MQTYVLDVRSRSITLASDDSTLVRTSRGVDEIELRFYDSEFFDRYDLNVAFACDDVIEEVRIPLLILESNPNEQEEAPDEAEDDEGESDEPIDDDESDEEYDDEEPEPEPDIGPDYDEVPESEQYLAKTTISVPDEILEHSGALGVTVYGIREDGNYIITALSEPLQIMDEGDDDGAYPQPSPYRG